MLKIKVFTSAVDNSYEKMNPAWKKYLKYLYISNKNLDWKFAAESILKDHNARLSLDTTHEYLEFDNELDASIFLLKWS